MQKLAYSLALLLVMSATSAFALTTDRSSNINADGTAKFSDPDDQTPAGLTMHSSQDGMSGQQNLGSSMTAPIAPGSGLGLSVNGGSYGQAPSGDAFDRAYSRFNDR